ncbi:Ltp family lipoprotein [Streptococcus uberis]|uniref:Ltp family lipoprotein n=1 Tax=Streptococcus uberis TaxID=1349 RepID=UPI0020BF9B22|nr:Ltp family lipoprotein [Streptococcus uberis]
MISVATITFAATPETSNVFTNQPVVVSAITKEYKNALQTAKMVKDTNMSKKAFYEMMTKESKFDKKAVDYAVKKLKINWKENALKQAKAMQDFGSSKEIIKEEMLKDGDGGGFTKAEVKYAIKHLEDKNK